MLPLLAAFGSMLASAAAGAGHAAMAGGSALGHAAMSAGPAIGKAAMATGRFGKAAMPYVQGASGALSGLSGMSNRQQGFGSYMTGQNSGGYGRIPLAEPNYLQQGGYRGGY
jgi:hypothetical protein